MNYNNKCNNYEICNECKNKYWMGEMIKLENWPEKGALCRECLIKIKIPCRNCSKFFNKIENFNEQEKENYEQHEKVDRKKWEKEKPNENFWSYIGFNYYIKGGQFCSEKKCRGHSVPQHGHFCSDDCYKESQGGIADRHSPKYLEWKTWAEKNGWTLCQEKDLFRDWDNHPKLRSWKEKIINKKGKQALACEKMAAPGEKYCFFCQCERENIKWSEDHRNNEKNYVKSYRDYWKLNNDKNDFSNNKENESESNNVISSNDQEEKSTEKIIQQLIEAKKGGKTPEETEKEIEKLKNELNKLNQKNQPTEEVKSTKNNDKVWIWSGVGVIFILIAGLFYISRKKKKEKK